MKTLDCENFTSTISSLEGIFNAEKSQIIQFINEIDLDKSYSNDSINEYANEYLYKRFLNNFKTDFDVIQSYWFHSTRVRENFSFDQGILPLKDMIQPTDAFIDTIARQLGIPSNDVSIYSCSTINHKLSTTSDSGPWGFLVKEFANNPPKGIHNYLRTPELVEDIIRFKYKDEISLLTEEYRKQTKPCLIKFMGCESFHSDNLSYVIYYVYKKIKNQELCMYCSTNTSNRGRLIPFDLIAEIEIIKKPMI